MKPATSTTIGFHITHWKAGSQWVRAIIKRLDGDRLVIGPAVAHLSGYGEQDRSGALFSPVYIHRDAFHEIVGHDSSHRKVVVIRDLRDAVVSWYFSARYSHGSNPAIDQFRDRLGQLSLEDGLLMVLEKPAVVMARTQTSWKHAPEDERLLFRYEDLILETPRLMNQLLDHLGVNPDATAREEAIEAESFENKTGRMRGQEDIKRHERKGVAGDWQNHFTDRVKDAFKEKFGQVLIDTGYESDLNW